MYHSRFKGTHYNAGYKWGELLYKNNNIISNKPTFILLINVCQFIENIIQKF